MEKCIKFALILTSIFVFIFIKDLYSQQGWFWQNPLPQGNHLNSVASVGNLVLIAGNGGAVIRSVTRGENWYMVNINTYYQLVLLKMVNANTGFLIRSDNTLYRTTDAGMHWDSVYHHHTAIRNMVFYNNSVGLLLCDTGKVYRTTNGGLLWTQIYSFSYNRIKINDGQYLNDSTIVCVGYNTDYSPPFLYDHGRVFKSTDGGYSWVNIRTVSGYVFSSLYFANELTGFVIGSDSFTERTTNGGMNWVRINTGAQGTLSKIQFVDSNTGYITSKYNNFFLNESTNSETNFYLTKTTNGGINWTPIQTTAFNDITVLDSITAVSAGSYGTILKTTNSGLNWSHKSLAFWTGGLKRIFAISDSILIAGGNGGHFLKTTDCGKTWIHYSSQATTQLTSLYFLNKNVGFATSSIKIMRTNNGGVNWDIQYTSVNVLESIFFKDINTGYVCGREHTFLKTTNGGTNWVDVFLDSSLSFQKVLFLDQNTGIVLAVNWSGITKPTILKTTNDGLTWNRYMGPVASMDMYFINHNTGFCGGYDNDIYKTTNGGVNWTTTPKPAGSILSSISFINENTGFIVGYFYTTFLKTTNCGANWYVDDPGLVYDDMFLHGIASKNGHATFVGDYGFIKSTRNVNSVFINNNETQFVSDYTLNQNYPNPFNSETKIEFNLPSKSNVTIIVYNLLGQKIDVLIDNKNLSAGRHHVNFNGGNLSSGVYFYNIKADEFTQTKRMILLK